MINKPGEAEAATSSNNSDSSAGQPGDVHGAISDRLKRFEGRIVPALESKLSELVDSRMKSIQEQLEKLTALPKPADAPTEDPMKALKEIEGKYRARMEQMEAERAQEKQRAAQQEERTELTKALSTVGVSAPAHIKAAVAVLYTEDKRISRDADGRIVFKGQDKYGEPAELDLEEGIRQWVNTDEGKLYLPPKPVSGSGATQQKRAGSPAATSRREKSENAMATIYNALRGGGGQ